jgi:hypothetical protein
MPTFLRTYISGLLLVLLVSGAVAPVPARAQDGRQEAYPSMIGEWLIQQREQMSRVDRLTMAADADHRVATTDGERNARYGMTFSEDLDNPQERRSLRYFIVDGDSLDVSEQRRVQRALSSLMTDDVGPLLGGLNMPVQLLSRAMATGQPETVMVEGRKLVRFSFVLEPMRDAPPMQRPGRRPGMGPGARPGAPGSRSGAQGARSGAQGRGYPAGRMSSDERPGPRSHVVALMDAETGALVETRVQALLPGGRRMVAETTYQREQGLDLPKERRVSGDLPVQRRLRVVTVSLENETRFQVEQILMKNR